MKNPQVKIYTFPWVGLLLILTATTTVAFFALTIGSVAIPFQKNLHILAAKTSLLPSNDQIPTTWNTIVWDIRLPRVVLSGLVGAALAIAGSTYQGIFRNHLADPYLIGVASGAGFGATVSILIFGSSMTIGKFTIVPINAFLASIFTVSIAYLLAKRHGGTHTNTLILAGVALGSLMSSLTTFLLMTSGKDIRPVLSFLFGSFSTASWSDIYIVLPYLTIGTLIILPLARILNILQLDQYQAQQLGVNTEKIRLSLLVCSSFITSSAISVSGIIGFVGLITPHCVRLVWGYDYRTLLPFSMGLGAVFLIMSDSIARVVLAPQEIPVGVITALFGSPFFLYILRKKYQVWY